LKDRPVSSVAMEKISNPYLNILTLPILSPYTPRGRNINADDNNVDMENQLNITGLTINSTPITGITTFIEAPRNGVKNDAIEIMMRYCHLSKYNTSQKLSIVS
jgi:hypothetical protein